MAKQNYFDKRDRDNIRKLGQYKEKLPEFCDDFFIGMENYSSTLTRLNYAMDLSVFFDYLSKYVFKKDVSDISLQDIDSLKSIQIEQFLSYLSYYEKDEKVIKNGEKGKARKLSSIRSLFKYLFNHDKISSNVASKVETPKIHLKEIVRLEEDEMSRMLVSPESNTFSTHKKNYNQNTKERDQAIITLLLGTGIRVSECVGLDIKDIDFSQNALKVKRKGGSEAILYFPEEVAESLKEWLKKRETLPIDDDENALFISLQNKRMCVRAVENMVKKFAKESSPLKKITPHKLRSTFGTNLYRETHDIYIVADVLGHKDVNTTKKHYAAISEDMRKSVAQKIKLKNWCIYTFYMHILYLWRKIASHEKEKSGNFGFSFFSIML